MPFLLPFLLLISSQLTVASWLWTNSFDCWFWQSAIVVNDWLYIDGGEWYDAQHNQKSLAGPLAVNLNQSWTIDTIDGQSFNNTKPAIISQYTTRRPAMWYDPISSRIIEQGGWSYGSSSNAAFSFAPDGNGGGSWSVDQAVQPASSSATTFGAAVAASSANAYLLGGVVVASTSPHYQAVGGLTTFSFGQNVWSNLSASAASSSGYSVLAQAAFVPNFGQDGVLAILGGDEPATTTTYQYEGGAALVQMSNITLYDVQSNSWYYQSTSGTVPPPRSEFCAAGVASQDNTTYEIYVFGGSTNGTYDVAHATDEGYLDVYILSIPSFRWFKAGSPTNNRRANHFCQHLGGGQLLVIGGRDPSYNASADPNFHGGVYWPDSSGGDPWTKGLNIFDMTALNWTGSYDATRSSYTPPDVVQQFAAQSSRPTWDNPALATIFAATPASTTTGPASGPTGTGIPGPHVDVGAIAGGVVGGVAVLVLVGVFVLCLVRRRKQQTQTEVASTSPPTQPPTYEMPPETKYEMQAPLTEMPGSDSSDYVSSSKPLTGSGGTPHAELSAEQEARVR